MTATDGLFDSGPIAPGGGFSITIAVPGSQAYASANNPALTGALDVSVTGLLGAPTDLADSHIPQLEA